MTTCVDKVGHDNMFHLHEIRHQQAVDDKARCVLSTHRGLANVLTECTHLVNQRKKSNYKIG